MNLSILFAVSNYMYRCVCNEEAVLRMCFLSLWSNSTSISEIWVVSFEYVRFLVSQKIGD